MNRFDRELAEWLNINRGASKRLTDCHGNIVKIPLDYTIKTWSELPISYRFADVQAFMWDKYKTFNSIRLNVSTGNLDLWRVKIGEPAFYVKTFKSLAEAQAEALKACAEYVNNLD